MKKNLKKTQTWRRKHNFLLSKKKNIKTLLASMVKTWVLNISKLE
ncbi:unnamed protein product [Brassica oleracea]